MLQRRILRTWKTFIVTEKKKDLVNVTGSVGTVKTVDMRSKEHGPFVGTFCDKCRNPACICGRTKSWVSEEVTDLNKQISSFLQETFESFEDKKEKVLKERLEILGIDINLEEESKRRFKSLVAEYGPDEETYYYNDGSVDGLRIVTFIVPKGSVDENNTTWSIKLRYY